LALLLEGIDWRRTLAPLHTERPRRVNKTIYLLMKETLNPYWIVSVSVAAPVGFCVGCKTDPSSIVAPRKMNVAHDLELGSCRMGNKIDLMHDEEPLYFFCLA
jgi:hypothetical protein